MNRTLVAVVVAVSFAAVAAGCGSDAKSDREVLADSYITQAAANGQDYDRACVTGLVTSFTDEDVKILAAEVTGTPSDPLPQLSPAWGNADFDTCAKTNGDTALVDQAVQKELASPRGAAEDPACVRTTMSHVPDGALKLFLTSAPDATDDMLTGINFGIFSCSSSHTTTS
ncbi:MAG TPA: hypothetical protein VGM78_03700 [Ilumatobacteraceae bacterium]